MDNRYKCLKQEVNEAQLELNTLSKFAELFFPPESSPGTTRWRRSLDEDELNNRTRRMIGAVAALAVGTGFILGEPINDAACKALSFFNRCDSTENLEQKSIKWPNNKRHNNKNFKQSKTKTMKNLLYFETKVAWLKKV